MQALKTRLSGLLAWWAFLHAGLLLDLTILWALGITPSTIAWFGAFVDAYSDFFLNEWCLILELRAGCLGHAPTCDRPLEDSPLAGIERGA